MDPRKAALQGFLDYSRDSLNHHMNNAILRGELPKEEAEKTLATFDERKNLILDTFDKQTGGAMKMPKVPQINLGNAPSTEEIQEDIDKLINFSPADHIAAPIKPILNVGLSIFIPGVRDTIKKIVGTAFVLGSLEQLPIFGPIIGSSLDIATTFMPTLAVTIQNILPNIIGLAPIPYAAYIGEIAGYVFASTTLFMTLMTQVTRGEFMEALEAGAGLVPVVGTTLMTYVNKGKKIFDKTMEMKQKIVVSLAKIKGLVLYLLPMVSKKVAKLLSKLLPIFDTVIKSAAAYLIRPANMVLDNVKPFLNSVKGRLSKIEKLQAARKGGRYTKYTRKTKRKSRLTRKYSH
jgi:hypothetical protein